MPEHLKGCRIEEKGISLKKPVQFGQNTSSPSACSTALLPPKEAKRYCLDKPLLSSWEKSHREKRILRMVGNRQLKPAFALRTEGPGLGTEGVSVTRPHVGYHLLRSRCQRWAEDKAAKPLRKCRHLVQAVSSGDRKHGY